MEKIKFFSISFYCFILLILFSISKIGGGFKVFSIQSGSMEPKIKTGSIVVVHPKTEYFKNDVITFKSDQITVTHRIVDIKNKDQKIFITKGDKNTSFDLMEIEYPQIIGKVILILPYFGYLINFSKTQQGLIILIVVPSVIIIYSEFLTIKNEIFKFIKKND